MREAGHANNAQVYFMRPTLPSAFRGFFAALAVVVVVGCTRHPEIPALPPAAPLPAAPDIELGTMQAECDAMIAALEAKLVCPNAEDDERAGDKATIERWRDVDFPALVKSKPDEPSQRAIALACRRATVSVAAAAERCRNGKRPHNDL
jgi:hypothetical protein